MDVLNPSGLTLRDSTLYGTTVGDFGRCSGFAVLDRFSHHLARTDIGFGTSSTREILMEPLGERRQSVSHNACYNLTIRASSRAMPTGL